jgi:outer membrane protein assembly factor BamB
VLPGLPHLVADADRVIAVDHDAMRALSATDGSLDWKISEDGDTTGASPRHFRDWNVHGNPVVIGDRVLVVSWSTPYALSTDDGSVGWSFPTDGTLGQLLGVGNVVFAGASFSGSTGDRLVALDRDSGLPRWQRITPEVPLAFAPGRELLLGAIHTVDGTGILLARDPVSGDVVWHRSFPGSPFPTREVAPAVAGGRVFGGRGPVTALSAADGSEVWSTSVGDADVETGLVTDGDGVYLAGGGVALSLDAGTGERRWTTRVETTRLASPVLTRETLYVPTPRGVTALRTENGTERFSYELDRPRWSVGGLIVADGRLYLRSERAVHALEGER